MVLEDQYTKAKQEGTSGEIAIPDTELKVRVRGLGGAWEGT